MANEDLSAYSAQVLNTVEHILVPGGRAKLSPYLEDTQIRKLFSQNPTQISRNQDIHRIVDKNDQRIGKLAGLWVNLYQDKSIFRDRNYADEEFRDLYLLYYFSTNVLKIQLMLLELARSRGLDDKLKVEDLGVGTGTTAIAVMDFLFLWKVSCGLYNVDFPINRLNYRGIDQNEELLEYAQEVVGTYCDVLFDREIKVYSDFVDFLNSSAEKFHWQKRNIEGNDFQFETESNLIIISYLLNELTGNGRKRLVEAARAIPDGTTLLCIEPGAGNPSKSLMRWRRQVMKSGHWSTGPCGNEFSQLPESCNQCWNSRRHSFHEPVLYKRFRKLASEPLDDSRRYDAFENRLLSWSAVWLRKEERMDFDEKRESRILGGDGTFLETAQLRYIGAYTSGSKEQQAGPAGYGPDEHQVDDQTGWHEYVKFCPGHSGANGLALIRKPGFQIPDLKHGDAVTIRKGSISKKDRYWELHLDQESQIIKQYFANDEGEFLQDYFKQTEEAMDEIGYRLFGFPNLHEFQHTILSRVMQGKSILGIAATGSGKSECFILPAMVLPGVTVVVSPLLSLMMDQYDQRIQERYGLGNLATFINGEVPFKERRARLKRMELGYYKLVYFTPEQLERGYILDSLRRADENVGVRYLAMDEAHCISQWGHDFRPSYLNLSRRFADHGMDPVRIALTATASPYVRQDICEELKLNPEPIEEGGDLLVESSNRPELNLIVQTHRRTHEKANEIVERLKTFLLENRGDQKPGSAIVFMPHTGGNPDDDFRTEGGGKKGKLSAGVTPFAAYLERELRTKVAIYHGKMEQGEYQEDEFGPSKKLGDLSDRTRREEQKAFIDGEKNIMVATKGFGMGIDKDNVRLIIHRTPPGNLESYAQEAGRAGRDGHQADVILQYSPDNPDIEGMRSLSDYEIQEYFLSEKYVREVDIRVMMAFLNSLQMEEKSSLYFTNDQAMQFFDKCIGNPDLANISSPYEWPSFSERRQYRHESEEHSKILDTGWVYQQKSDYINKILQVLYKIRPTVMGQPRVTFLDQLHEIGINVIQPRVLKPDAIVNSNVYYGDIFRGQHIKPESIQHYLNQDTINPLAQRLGLPLHETVKLLYDIKYTEGKFDSYNRWHPELLDFKAIVAPRWGPAKELNDLESWRAYAGAYQRAIKKVAYSRAKEAGRKMKTYKGTDGKIKRYRETILDDWFNWKECNSSRGWEIVPGDVFFKQENLNRYIEAFVDLHDRREKNDWASYNRLLTGYIGVEEGNSGRSSGEKDCLRAVLLGYLDTNEVVTGGNCYSCSRCVPDMNFRKYSMEKRASAVVKLKQSISALLDKFEKTPDAIPPADQVQELLISVLDEEESGQSVTSYINGWSIRLLDQMPDHQPAMWVRIAGMMEGILPVQTEELLETLEKFLTLPEQQLGRLSSLTEEPPLECKSSAGWYYLKAQIEAKVGRPEEALDYLDLGLQLLLEDEELDKSMTYKLASSCIRLCDENDLKVQKDWRLLLARTAPEFKEALKYYSQLVAGWSEDEVSNELSALEGVVNRFPNVAALMSAADNFQMGEDGNLALEYVRAHPRQVRSWPSEAVKHFLHRLPIDYILELDNVFDEAIVQAENPKLGLSVGLSACLAGRRMTKNQAEKLLKLIIEYQEDAHKFLEENITDTEDEDRMLNRLINIAADDHPRAMVVLLEVYPYEISLEKRQDIFNLIADLYQEHYARPEDELVEAAVSGREYKRDLADFLFASLERFMDNDYVVQDAINQLMELSIKNVSILSRLLGFFDKHNLVESAEELFEKILGSGDISVIIGLEDPPNISGWKDACYFSQKVKFLINLKYFHRSYSLESHNINTICQAFDWREDQEKADMLSVVLSYLIEHKLNPNWKTPIAKLVEVYVEGGRIEEAQALVKAHSGLLISVNGKRMSARKFVNGLRPRERSEPINENYSILLEKLVNT